MLGVQVLAENVHRVQANMVVRLQVKSPVIKVVVDVGPVHLDVDGAEVAILPRLILYLLEKLSCLAAAHKDYLLCVHYLFDV